MTAAALSTPAAPPARGLEVVSACAICGGAQFTLYEQQMYALDGQALGLWQCRACAFVFVSPRPTPDRLRELYASARYYETDYNLGVQGSSYFARKDSLLAHYDRVVAALERDQPKGRILEVGAAGGFFLEAARRRGWTVHGVEISPFAAEYARRELGLPVDTADVMEAALPAGSQEVVYVDNILEHTIDPVAVLRRVHELLAPGGLLVVIVPTYVNSPWFRALKRLRSSGLGTRLAATRLGALLKLSRDVEALPYHIDEFTPANLAAAMERAGFAIERRLSSVPIPDYLEGRATSPVLMLQKVAFAVADALMRGGLLPGARVEVWGRKPR